MKASRKAVLDTDDKLKQQQELNSPSNRVWKSCTVSSSDEDAIIYSPIVKKIINKLKVRIIRYKILFVFFWVAALSITLIGFIKQNNGLIKIGVAIIAPASAFAATLKVFAQIDKNEDEILGLEFVLQKAVYCEQNPDGSNNRITEELERLIQAYTKRRLRL